MHGSNSQKKAGIPTDETKVALTAALYRAPQASKIAVDSKGVGELSNKLDSRFRIHTEGNTTNQKIYKGK